MKSTEELKKELDDITKESFDKAKELSELLKKYDSIETGDTEELTDEEKENLKGFYASIDARRQGVLRRLLIEWGGLLFM